ncbi:putative triacylglycerol lipase [Medicago truncatula]|uniref:Putative triacylglycerol lipase n=1 Tax=Medicago truncatula TaxID=3880 RepID=A0A396HCI1_MEDTR|nr:putative triacylglycerol lipase [Medicago truncatula]
MTMKQMIFVMFFSFFSLNLLSPIFTLPLAPALYVFGDSLLDNGNNNFLPTLARANFLPYGVDFPRGPTGRFSNGRTVADFLAEYLGLPYSPPYLSFGGLGSLSGVNYASGSCGILPESGHVLALHRSVIPIAVAVVFKVICGAFLHPLCVVYVAPFHVVVMRRDYVSAPPSSAHLGHFFVRCRDFRSGGMWGGPGEEVSSYGEEVVRVSVVVGNGSGDCGERWLLLWWVVFEESGKCITLTEQINLFGREIKRDLTSKVKYPTELSDHLQKSIFIISAGSNDYINNFLQPQFYDSSKFYQPKPFAEHLIENFSQQLKTLYELGARKIVVFEIGPIGCIPAISRTHEHTGECMEEANKMALYFNEKLSAMLKNLTSSLPGSTFVLGQSYSIIIDLYKNPSIYGLIDGRNPCCTTWQHGTSACIPFLRPCMNPSKHIFWDAFHLTEVVYSVVASRCFRNSSSCSPVSIQELVKI